MKKIVIAALAVLGSASAAFAADLPVKALAPPPAPLTDWSGFYIGVHGGYGWNGTNDWECCRGDLIGTNNINGGNSWNALKGGLAGGQIGYNWQMNRIVFGVQGDGSWADIKGSAGNPLNLIDGRCSFDGTPDQTAECRTTIRAMGNLTARVGYLVTPSTLRLRLDPLSQRRARDQPPLLAVWLEPLLEGAAARRRWRRTAPHQPLKGSA